MGNRRGKMVRCRLCRMHEALCVCALAPELQIATRVLVVMHRREASMTTATAHLAALCLGPQCQIWKRGAPGSEVPSDLVHGAGAPLLLFPSDDAEVLSKEMLPPGPVTLIVPDGSWRQAAKVSKREPALRDVRRVVLPDLGPTRYWLRSRNRPNGLATLEAISRALGIIEGPEIQRTLDVLFDTMVDRTLSTRGMSPPPSEATL